MKSLFIVGAKLVGIWIASSGFLSLLMACSFLFKLEEGELSNWLITYFPLNLPSIVVGIFLVAKANWLSGFVGFREDDSTFAISLNERTMLSIGIRLLGLYLFVVQLDNLVANLYSWIQGPQTETLDRPDSLDRHIFFFFITWTYLVPLYLVFGWRRITDILDRPAKVGKALGTTAEA